MLTIRRILFPTDFSDGAARAFPQAVDLADRHDAELHIVHVADPQDEEDTTLPVSRDVLQDWLAESLENSPALEGLSIVQEQVESDVPPERLVAYAEDMNIDLVVMGTHGRRGVRRMLMGSVTEEVVRKAPCPVLTVRTDTEGAPAQSIRRILVPVDFSDASEVAVDHAAEIASAYGAELTLLHVVEEVIYPSAYGVESPDVSSSGIVGRAEATLEEMARENIGDEPVQVAAGIGYAPLTILDYAKRNEMDLIVLATHGRTGFDRILLGSVAERVMRQAPTPVFLVKPNQQSLVSAATITGAPSSE
ncbi:MAG: universal stress protein [Salinibacter sp.]